MAKHIVFVSTELDPIAPGGAGTVVAGLARALRTRGDRVTVLLVVPEPTPSSEPFVVETVVASAEIEEHGWAMAASRAAHKALVDLVDQSSVDIVEFQDFDGLGFWTLSHREAALSDLPIGIRYHLPADHILDAMEVAPEGFRLVRVMEREALASADFVISQTETMRPGIVERYGIDGERVVVGVPPVTPVERVDRVHAPSPRFCVIGRLSEQKGVHDLVATLAPLLIERRDVEIEFIGTDGWSATSDRPMSEVLLEIVAPDVRSQLVFTGSVPRADLPRHLAAATAVIVPSRLESFCLVAHEVRNMGVPLIIRNQPAIAEHFSQRRGALLYDDPEDLATIISEVLEDPADLESVIVDSCTPGDVTGVYEDLPDPRPRQAQAGLATAALYRFDAVAADDNVQPGRTTRLARAVLRHLPDPVARLAVSVMPGTVKDRFRSVASWPEEQQRRRAQERRDTVRDQVAAGAFPEIDEPDVSVIIPCFNQGHLVEAAVLSVFEQTYGSWEIIIVDDGSTDDATSRILASIDMPRVQVITQENRGLPGARNTAIEASRGGFIVPLDADDELLPAYLETMLSAFDADIGFVHCWAELFGDVNWVWATRPYNPYTVLLSNSVLQTAMIRRKTLADVGGYDESLTTGNEDWDMWLRIQEAGWSNRQVREPLYRYRKAGITMSVTNEAAFEEGRRRMVERHPDLYAIGAVTASKRTHYPLLSLVMEGDTIPVVDIEIDDIQIVFPRDTDDAVVAVMDGHNWGWVTGGTNRCASVLAATGKYVLFATGSTPLSDVEDAIETLERDGSLAFVSSSSGTTVYRRWALIDRSAEFGGVPTDFAACQDPDWFVPSEMVVGGRSLEVVRQVPEELGPLPHWLKP